MPTTQDGVTTLPDPTETPPGSRGEVYLFPMSFAQQRLWFLSRLDPGTAAYNVSNGFRVRGPLRIELLRQAFLRLAERHETLRTTFSMVDGEPFQVVAARPAVDLRVVDVAGLGPEERRGRGEAAVAEVSRRPFDLVEGPLWRVLVVRLEPREHLLLYGLHHIVTDAWSNGVVVREVSALYRSLGAGEPTLLEELPLQYGDYAQWEAEWLQGEVLEGLLDFWRRELEGAPRVLDLPTDFPRPASFASDGEAESLSLPPDFTASLEVLARRTQATPFLGLLSALGVVLSRYAGQRDLLVGSPVAHREQQEIEGLIGFFVNTMVLRVDLAGDPTFEELVARVRERFLAAQEHVDLPFDKLVGELDLPRDRSRNPLVQVVLNVENVKRERPPELGGLSLSPLDPTTHSAKFDLAFGVGADDGGTTLSVGYPTRLFTSATARRLLDAFREVLLGAVEDPSRRVSELGLMSVTEERRLMAAAQPRAPEGAFAPGRTLIERFAEQARRRPDAVALTLDGACLTYRELERRSEALALRLRATLRGDPDARVGLLMERSVETVVSLLAVLEAGGAYVPLDPASPRRRLELLLEDSSASLLLVQRRLRDLVPDTGCPVIEVEDALGGDPPPPGATSGSRGPAGGPESPAYVIYTSGSTGTPKGVVVSHRNVDRLLACTEARFGFGPDDVWTLFHSHAFDFSVWEIWGALAYGGRLVVVPYWVSRSPDRLRRLLATRRVSVLNQTPSAFYQLLQADEAAEAADLSALRWVIFGGEALEVTKLAPWWRRHREDGPRLVNMYGITETTVHVTYRELGEDDLETRSGSAIGEAIADLGVLLLDGAGRPVPPCFPGEMYVRGGGVSRGYLGRPALTAARFVPDPHPLVAGGRLYRTGDLARRLEDGELEYLGRVDEQVQVHGFRVEPGEVEAALVCHPEVAEAVVVATGEGADRSLVAYLVARPGAQPPGTQELRRFLAERLPAHLVPSWFLALDAIPLTANGKLDRDALPTPGGARPELDTGYTAPRTPLEEVLSTVWREALGVDRVGVHDNFFSLGGDSIRSLRVVSLARERGFEIPVHQLFELPTVAELALEIATAGNGDSPARTAPFSLLSEEDRERLPPGVEDAYPLASLQAGMLYHQGETPDEPLFHNLNSYHFRIPFHEEAFRRAIDRAVERHPILRTSFDLARYSEPLQLVHRQVASPLTVEDLRHLSPRAQEEVLEAYWSEERHRPLERSSAPQVRFRVHRRTDDSFQFTLTENHAILDGWSLHTLYSEILGGYFAEIEDGARVELPPLRTTYSDFIALEREALASAESSAFWERTLADATLLRLPRWAREGAVPAAPRFRRFQTPIPAEVLQALHRRAEAWAVPLKTLLLTAHVQVMSLVSGERDVLTALSTNGRLEIPDGDRVCGLFLNTLPLRVRTGGGSWEDLVRRVYETELAILPHRRYPVAALQQRRGREPLFETAFVYLNFHVMGDVLQARNLELVENGPMVEETNFALSTTFHHGFGETPTVRLSLDCGAPEISDAQLRALTGHYLYALSGLAFHPGAAAEPESLLTAAERHAALREWNDTGAPAGTPPIHRCVEQVAAQVPERIAVSSETGDLSYGELVRRARVLAARLRAAGVAPEDAVGMLLERSPEMIVVVLGILEAGGVFLALDPDLPEDRIALLVDDARPRVVVTTDALAERLPPATATLAPGGSRPTGGEDAVGPERSPDHLAYLIYTSGSTGSPKGVGVSHRALSHHALQRRLAGLVDAEDRVLFYTTVSFDPSVWELVGPLVAGACILVAPPGVQRDPASQVRFMAERGVTTMHATPSLLRVLVYEPGIGGCSSLRRMLCGGELLTAELQEQVHARLGAELHDLYGPTETTIEVVRELCPSGAGSGDRCIGRPIRNVQAHVLDGTMRLVPPGTPGQLFVGGESLARGYLGRPRRTAESFVPDPFGKAGARLYGTGDLASRWPDGRLDFLGRVDRLMKVRGVRIEPGEVERALLEHPGVGKAAVAVRGRDEPRLLAWVVPADGEAPSERDLRAFLARKLPRAMMPSSIVTLEALPLLPSGKLDVEALPSPADLASPDRSAMPPRDLLEMQLVHLWEDLLDRPGIGITDDFFEVGGNSLLAVRLVAGLRERFREDLTLAELLDAATIEGLAARIRGEGRVERPGELVVPMQPLGGRNPFYCVAPGHGSILCYVPLARHMGTERPFYGLQWPTLEGGEDDPYLSVEELAARYVDALAEVQPDGPYLLGGWSFGGLVAFEMAHHLQERGDEVEAVVLIDARTPELGGELLEMDGERMTAFLLLEHAKEIAGISARQLPVSPDDLVGLPFEAQLEVLYDRLDLADRLPSELQPEMIRRYLALRIARFESIRAYRPRRYDGRIVLFRVEEVYSDSSLDEVVAAAERAARNPTYGWDALTTEALDVRAVPGDHESVVYEPHVQELAREMCRFFAELEPRAPRGGSSETAKPSSRSQDRRHSDVTSS